MKKIFYSWKDVQGAVLEIARQMSVDDNWRPDYIVGITRGGLIPANLLSQYTGIKMHTLNVSLRDSDSCESNLWMAEDAFGYLDPVDREYDHIAHSLTKAKNILIVDDIIRLHGLKMIGQKAVCPIAIDGIMCGVKTFE
jgi:hypoxanthine phosphoribosyltransferase